MNEAIASYTGWPLLWYDEGRLTFLVQGNIKGDEYKRTRLVLVQSQTRTTPCDLKKGGGWVEGYPGRFLPNIRDKEIWRNYNYLKG